ncbi:uncharacterized protein [Nicotiana sylvestris]|uniref:uncharacterized protein n=1 Tax=Nicotiana sylvestris TaxID=4096 RepID=UPI00388CEAA8
MAEYGGCIFGLKMAIDINVQELLMIGDLDLLIHQLRGEWELRKRFTKTEFQHVPRIQNEFADVLATLSPMIQYPDKNFVDPIPVKIYNQLAYCAHVEEEADGKPWFHDIKEYLAKGEYPELVNPTQKRTLRRLSNNFFHSGGILYRRTPDLGLLRYVDAKEASRLLEEIHAWTYGQHMNGKPTSNDYPSRSDPAPVPSAISNLTIPVKSSNSLSLDVASVLEMASSVYSADGS